MGNDDFQNILPDDGNPVELSDEEMKRLLNVLGQYYTNVNKLYEGFLKNLSVIRKKQEKEKLIKIKEGYSNGGK